MWEGNILPYCVSATCHNPWLLAGALLVVFKELAIQGYPESCVQHNWLRLLVHWDRLSQQTR